MTSRPRWRRRGASRKRLRRRHVLGDATGPPAPASLYLMPALRSVSHAVERGHHSRLPEALSARISIAFLLSGEFASAAGSPVRDSYHGLHVGEEEGAGRV